jgi:hypothetical protein
MNIRTRLLAGVLGSAMFAGAALAAGTSDMSLVTAAKQGDRAAVQSLLSGPAKKEAATAQGTAALVWAVTRNDTAMVDMLLKAGVNVKAPTNSARRRFTRLLRSRIRRWRQSCWRPGAIPIWL